MAIIGRLFRVAIIGKFTLIQCLLLIAVSPIILKLAIFSILAAFKVGGNRFIFTEILTDNKQKKKLSFKS